MSDRRRFLPLPYEAVEAFEGSELLLVVDLYRRAHALRWRSFSVTHRSLATRFGLGARRVRSVLVEVVGLGLGTVEHGSKRRATRVLLTCPTRDFATDGAPLNASQGAPNEVHNLHGASMDDDDRASQGAPLNASQGASLLMRSKTETIDLEDRGRARDPVPKWLRTWLKTDGRAVGRPAIEVLGALGRTLEAIRGKPGNVVESAGRSILRLWREMLAEGISLGDNLEGLVEPVALMGAACRLCPDPIFARDVRGEGWENGRDRSRNIAAICRLAPPSSSSGATWQERLEAARRWDTIGRPTAAASTAKGQNEKRSNYLHRLDRIASEAP